MWHGWYSLLWTPKEIRVIFNTDTHRIQNTSKQAIPTFDPKHLANIEGLAKQHGLDVGYMQKYLGKGISDFSKAYKVVK